jgi:MoxR-like ATPase
LSEKLKSDDIKTVDKLNQTYNNLKKEISKVIVGQEQVVNHILTALFSRGHCLLIGAPGLAKTLLIKTIAEALDLSFNRIQFTPDLMPSDITGSEILEEDQLTKKRNFRFIKGPVFANIILADEINRTPPKTQSALLEAMQERRTTIGGVAYNLPDPFFVMATQNPIEQEGTYPLPEAQLDRFMFNLWINYPSLEEETNIVKLTTSLYSPKIEKIVGQNDIIEFQDIVKKIPASDETIKFAVNLSRQTRPNFSNLSIVNDYVNWGAGPRASQFLILAAKTKAALEGRYMPTEDDVAYFALPTLRHRIILNFSAAADGITVEKIIEEVLKTL